VPESEIFVVNHNDKIFQELSPVSTQAIREYLFEVWKHYKKADRKLKSQILDEICRNLKVHRKAAVRLLGKNYPPRSYQGFRGGRKKKYSAGCKEHLERLWKAMGYMGPRRMKAALKDWLPYDTHKDCTAEIRIELETMSAASIGRFLKRARSTLARQMNTGTYRGVKRFIAKVPLRPLGETPPTEPGYCEVDCVAHCGGSLAGDFAWTVNLTDIASGWTECEAIWCKNSVEVRRALRHMEARLPFPLKALYFDNGSEFMNEVIVERFAKDDRAVALPIYRGRPYRKNDQAYVEQKNYTHVRHLFGYGRIDWKNAISMMNDVYRKEWRLLQNLFMPQQKLIEKQRHGSSLKRFMDDPVTPINRLKPYLSMQAYQSLEDLRSNHNPFACRHNQRCKIRKIFGYFKNSIHKNEWGKMAL